MTDLKLTQSFSMIALNAQDSLYTTVVKKVALRCMAASVILEACLESGLGGNWNRVTLQNTDRARLAPYCDTVISPLLRRIKKDLSLKWWLKSASALSNKKLKKLEQAVADSLREMNLLEEIPNLLGCDLYYDSAGVLVMEYRSNMQEYDAITETIKAEILEDGPVTDETVCMLWLLRESGCFWDFFSRNELERVAVRMNELYRSNPLARALYTIRVRHGFEIVAKQFLHWKKTFFRKPFEAGVNFVFPFLERSQSVFIDTEAWFSNSATRLEDVERRLRLNGHEFTVLHAGPVPLIKIDNVLYNAVPQAIYDKVPIHGVRLLPKRHI